MTRDNLIIVNVDLGETRVALVENGIIVELLVERAADRSIVGNIYRGRVVRVLPGMQAAFVDCGLERHAFLHVSDIVSAEEGGAEDDADPDAAPDPDADDEPSMARRITRRTPIRDVIKEGEAIAVQIAKDPIGTKGSRVTADVSLAGRHLVYMPYSARGGVSRRITDEGERRRLSKVLKRIAPPKGALIARTVAAGASADALEADACYLVVTWNEIRARNKAAHKPCLLWEELSLPLRVARDSLNDSVAEMVVDDPATSEKLRAFVDRLMPNRLDAIRRYDGAEPIFDAFGIESEIKRALERVVELPSGGSLVIDQGEALTAIDVNTGKFVGKGSKDQEETIFRTNLEAVDEIAYQVRFRNIGGLIVLDLIDMDRPANRREVMNRLQKALKDDRAKTSISPISRFGLLEMTRERTRESLGRQLHEKCAHCDGTGHTLSRVTVAHEVLREVQRRHDEFAGPELEVRLHPHVAEVLKGEGARLLKELEQRTGKRIALKPEGGGHPEEFHVRARRGGGGKEGS